MCYRPVTIKDPNNPGHYMKVPCGKCLDCLRQYQNDWSNRMYEEFKSKGFKGVFFTLTYDDKHVPKNYFAEGLLFRSRPDYGYENVRWIPEHWVYFEKDGKKHRRRVKGHFGAHEYDFKTRTWKPCRARKKYAEKPTQVLTDYGIDTDFIEDFNIIRTRKKRDSWFEAMSECFCPEDIPDFSPSLKEPLQASEAFDPEKYLDLSEYDLPYWDDVDKESGEILFNICDPIDYERLRAWYRTNTPTVSFNSVRVEDVQGWIKRNRARSVRSGAPLDFSYFITSEYGPKTFRPHYHGVLFGVSADDVREWFEDWKIHFGEIVRFDNLDPSKGGLSYVAKYCSKGVFEHPLCSRDFFYRYTRLSDFKEVVCNEYHSKHYERCMEWFGVDLPLVDPTFHLCSKGLGVAYVDSHIHSCQEFEDIASSAIHNSYVSHSPIFVADAGVDASDMDDFYRKVDEAQYRFVQEPLDRWFERFLRKGGRYARNFHFSKDGQVQDVVVNFALPRYYRKKMFGPNLRVAYPLYVRNRFEADYKRQFYEMATANPSRTDAEISLELEAQARQKLVDSFNRSFDWHKRFFEKAQV